MKDIINSLAVALNPALSAIAVAIVGYIASVIVKYVKNKSVLLELENVAEDGVVLAEKAGVVKYLTGNEKFEKALQYVTEKTGLTADEVKDTLEKAFVLLKSDLENAYTQKTKEEEEAEALATKQAQEKADEEAKEKAKADALAKAKEQAEEAQKALSALQADTTTQTTQATQA